MGRFCTICGNALSDDARFCSNFSKEIKVSNKYNEDPHDSSPFISASSTLTLETR